ncbi:MAG: aspartate--tRNA ligase [Patescibacteria group bacterium]
MYKTAYRTHTCNDLTGKAEGAEVTLTGWVDRRRDHGSLIFIDLRDRFGVTQIVTDPELSGDAHKTFETVRPEWVLQIIGKVRARPTGQENKKMTTGEIEILVGEVKILNESQTPPFEIAEEHDENEEVRLQYRYLDLRRKRMQRNMVLHHRIWQAVRKFFYKNDFVEIETPILIKGTPEGAREYIVPSRVHPGKFYVLPQSPQQLKQLSQVAGFDRYMQIARCFRDEDQRGDRQPEFTQMDLEMSFVDAEDVIRINEKALKTITKECRPDVKLKAGKFPRFTYQQALDKFGNDSPDLRYELEIVDVSKECKGCGFGIFADVVKSGGKIKVLKVPGGAVFSRKDIEALEKVASIYGAKGLAWIKIQGTGASLPADLSTEARRAKVEALAQAGEQGTEKALSFEGVPVSKLGEKLTQKISTKCKAESGDILFFAADEWRVACESLGAVRIAVAKKLKLLEGKENEFAYCWITDFPMFEKDAETGEVGAVHHPFTRPKKEDHALLDSDPLKARAEAYDVVLNGYEIGGGSIRIHERTLQKKIFDILKISDRDAERRFGHILRAFSYGAPPHGGIAWGLDRIAMIFAGEPNIREVIAFPKTNRAEDLMLGAPDIVPAEQLKELEIVSTAQPTAERDVFAEIERLLNEKEIKFEVLDHEPVKTSEEAAEVRGSKLEQGARALVWKTENGYIQSVCSGVREVDEGALKEVAGVRELELATLEEVKAVTGCERGAVPPFGNIFGLPVFVEKSLAANTEINFNAGSRTKSIKMQYADYAKVVGEKVSRFAK